MGWKTVPVAEGCSENNYKEVLTSTRPGMEKVLTLLRRNLLRFTVDEEMSKEKEIYKLMALISLLGTGYDKQREVNVVGARENVGTPVVQKSRIQCYNCKEYGHVSRECQKPKRVKDAA
ncbi:retrovirus-related pol polyprotein from transposon TNT 1-94 [Tanacetum coccineum]